MTMPKFCLTPVDFFNILHYLHNTNKEASSIWQLMICKCCLLFSNLVHFRLISTYL